LATKTAGNAAWDVRHRGAVHKEFQKIRREGKKQNAALRTNTVRDFQNTSDSGQNGPERNYQRELGKYGKVGPSPIIGFQH